MEAGVRATLNRRSLASLVVRSCVLKLRMQDMSVVYGERV